MMTPEAKQRIQIALLLALVVAGVRAGYILYERHEEFVAAQKQEQAKKAGYSNTDYYVTPKKLHPYDLKSAMQLTQQPVWVKEGYRYTYYRHVPVVKSVDFAHEAGLLGALERLEIKDVMAVAPPGGREGGVGAVGKDWQSLGVAGGFVGVGQERVYFLGMVFVGGTPALDQH